MASLSAQLFSILQAAIQLAKANEADGLLLLLEDQVDWKKLKTLAS